jgi:hypothetical protein
VCRDNRIPAGEVDEMHVSQTKTMVQVAIQSPLDPSRLKIRPSKQTVPEASR